MTIYWRRAAQFPGYTANDAWGYANAQVGLSLPVPTPPSGQSPAGSRYRTGHRADWIHYLIVLACGGWWL